MSKNNTKTQRRKVFSKEIITPYLFILPALLLIVLFYGYPFIKTVYMSFMNYNIVDPKSIAFNNFENYKNLLTDPVLKLAAKNTIIWVFVSLIIQFVLGFILALLLWKPFKGKKLYQSVVFIPWAISGFLIGIIFRWMFNAQFGVISDILIRLGIMHNRISILSMTNTSLIGPIVGLVWYGVPFFAIMILAAIQGISDEVLEAADIDGAGRWIKLFRIVIPYIKPTILVTVLLRVIWIFNSADIIYIMTNGGPANSSHTLATYLFQKAYTNLDFGSASAISVLIMLFLAVYTIIYLIITKFNEAGDF